MRHYILTADGYLPVAGAEALFERNRKEDAIRTLSDRWNELASERADILDEMVEITRQIEVLRAE